MTLLPTPAERFQFEMQLRQALRSGDVDWGVKLVEQIDWAIVQQQWQGEKMSYQRKPHLFSFFLSEYKRAWDDLSTNPAWADEYQRLTGFARKVIEAAMAKGYDVFLDDYAEDFLVDDLLGVFDPIEQTDDQSLILMKKNRLSSWVVAQCQQKGVDADGNDFFSRWIHYSLKSPPSYVLIEECLRLGFSPNTLFYHNDQFTPVLADLFEQYRENFERGVASGWVELSSVDDILTVSDLFIERGADLLIKNSQGVRVIDVIDNFFKNHPKTLSLPHAKDFYQKVLALASQKNLSAEVNDDAQIKNHFKPKRM